MGFSHLFGFVLLLSWLCLVLSDSEQNDETGYDFSYNVYVPQSGNYHGHRQRKDANGRTSGTYYLMGPDGVWHETTFSDFGGGFEALNKKRSMSSLPEMAKYAEDGLAVFFRMGKKSRNTEKSKPITASPNTIPIGSDAEDFPKRDSSPGQSTSTISPSSSSDYALNKGERKTTSHISIENITSSKPTIAKNATSSNLKNFEKESNRKNISSHSDTGIKQTKTGKDFSFKSSNTQVASSVKPTKPETASSLKSAKTETASSIKLAKTETASSIKPVKTESTSNRKSAKTETASTLKPPRIETASSLKLAKIEAASSLKQPKTEIASTLKINKTEISSILKSTESESSSTLKPSKSESSSSLKSIETGSTRRLKSDNGKISGSLRLTKAEGDSNIKTTKTEDANTQEPPKIESTSTLKPTVSSSTNVLKPTLVQSTSSFKPTSSHITTPVKSSKSKSGIFRVPSSLTRITDPDSVETEDSPEFRFTTPGSRQNYDVGKLQSFETPSSSESSGSFENSESYETTSSTLPKFNHFTNLVTPFLKPTLVPSTPTPLDEVSKKNPFVVDFGPFSGKFGKKAAGEVVRHFRTEKIGGTRVFEEALSDEDKADEDDDEDEEERKGKKDKKVDVVSIPKTSLRTPIFEGDVKDKIGLPIRFTKLPNATGKQGSTTIFFTNKGRKSKEEENEKNKEKGKEEEEEEQGEEEEDEDDETRNVFPPIPPKGRSLYSNPRLTSRRKNYLNTKLEKEVATTSVSPKATSYAVTRFTNIPISTTPETPQSTEDISSETNLKVTTKTIPATPVIQISDFKESSKLKGNFQRVQNPSSKSSLPKDGKLKKPEEVINKISFIDLAGPQSAPISLVGGKLNQLLKGPNFTPRRVVLPRDHKLVDILRKMAKDKPNVVSTKPFFVPLASNPPNQVHLSGNSVDLLTIASNSGSSYKIAPSLNDLPHSNQSKSKFIDPLNSLKKTSFISQAQPRTFNQNNANQFIDQVRKEKVNNPYRSFPPKEITLTPRPGHEKSIPLATEAPKSGLRIVKAKLNAVRLLEPMPLSQYINLINRPTTPQATFVIDGFPLNQAPDNKFSETSIRPSKIVRDQILQAMKPKIHKSVPFRLLRYAPNSQNQNIDAQTSKETKILMIKRHPPNSKVSKNKVDEQTDSEDLGEKPSDKETSAFSSQEKSVDEASKQLETVPGVTEGETNLYLAMPPS